MDPDLDTGGDKFKTKPHCLLCNLPDRGAVLQGGSVADVEPVHGGPREGGNGPRPGYWW